VRERQPSAGMGSGKVKVKVGRLKGRGGLTKMLATKHWKRRPCPKESSTPSLDHDGVGGGKESTKGWGGGGYICQESRQGEDAAGSNYCGDFIRNVLKRNASESRRGGISTEREA